MKKKLLHIILIAALLFLFLGTAAYAEEAGESAIDGEATFLADTLDEAQRVAEGYNATLKSYSYGVGVLCDFREAEVSEIGLEAMNEETGNDLPELSLNGKIEACDLPDTDDPVLDWQWYLDAIDAADAWKVTTGETTGKPVVVAVLDSGIDVGHNDLADKVLRSTTQITDRTDTSDDIGHGTHVAGIIAALADNGIGIAGVAPDIKLISIKVLDAGGNGDYAGVIRGIKEAVQYAADNNCRVIINMSLGGSVPSKDMQTAITNAYNAEVMVVAAAGNSQLNLDYQKYYPAAMDNVFCVAAADGAVCGYDSRGDATTVSSIADGSLPRSTAYSKNSYVLDYTYSNFGSCVDITAPGTYVMSTARNTTDECVTKTGTSMATPMVAAVAALIETAYPQLTVAQVETLIRGTATRTDENGEYFDDNKKGGGGLINAGDALTKSALVITDYGPFSYDGDTVPVPENSQYTMLIHDGTEVSFNYWRDAACTVSTDADDGAERVGGAPSEQGVYYVTAVIEATDSYTRSESAAYRFTINRKITGAKVTIRQPVLDEYPTMWANVEGNCEATYVLWLDKNNTLDWSSKDRYTDGMPNTENYSMSVYLQALPGWEFPAKLNINDYSINGKTPYYIGRKSDDVVLVQIYFGEAAESLTLSSPYASSFEASAKINLGDYYTKYYYESWKLLSGDGDGKNWSPIERMENSVSGIYSMLSLAGGIQQDNWMVSDAITLTDGDEVSFYAKPADAAKCDEHIGVYITTGTGTATSQFTLLCETTLADCDWTKIYADASDWHGKTVRFALRHFHSGTSGGVYVDDFKIGQSKVEITVDTTPQTAAYAGEAVEFSVKSDPEVNGFAVKYRLSGTIAFSDKKPSSVGIYDVLVSRQEDEVYKAVKTLVQSGIVIDRLLVDRESLDFGTANKGYSSVGAEYIVLISEAGAEMPDGISAESQFFDIAQIDALSNDDITLCIQPKNGLPVGKYSETVTVSNEYGIEAQLLLSFEVKLGVLLDVSADTENGYLFVLAECDSDEETYLTAAVYNLDGKAVAIKTAHCTGGYQKALAELSLPKNGYVIKAYLLTKSLALKEQKIYQKN